MILRKLLQLFKMAFSRNMIVDKPIVVVLGATGTGKSKLAIEIARKFNGEIISADSMQVYNGLDIITNKVTEEEQQLARHHLLDFVDPLHPFNVKDFQKLALETVSRLHSEGKLPVVVGGTHYYIESVLWNVLVDYKKSAVTADFDDQVSAESESRRIEFVDTIKLSAVEIPDKNKSGEAEIIFAKSYQKSVNNPIEISYLNQSAKLNSTDNEKSDYAELRKFDCAGFGRQVTGNNVNVCDKVTINNTGNCADVVIESKLAFNDKFLEYRANSNVAIESASSQCGSNISCVNHSEISTKLDDIHCKSDQNLFNDSNINFITTDVGANIGVEISPSAIKYNNKFIEKSVAKAKHNDDGGLQCRSSEVQAQCESVSSARCMDSSGSRDTSSRGTTDVPANCNKGTSSSDAAAVSRDSVRYTRHMPDSTESLYEQLCRVDPERAECLQPLDRRKIIRSLEVWQQSGVPHSKHLQRQRQEEGGSVLGGGIRYPNTVLLWTSCDQDVLDSRLNGRVDDMIERGLLAELLGFHEQYNKHRFVAAHGVPNAGIGEVQESTNYDAEMDNNGAEAEDNGSGTKKSPFIDSPAHDGIATENYLKRKRETEGKGHKNSDACCTMEPSVKKRLNSSNDFSNRKLGDNFGDVKSCSETIIDAPSSGVQLSSSNNLSNPKLEESGDVKSSSEITDIPTSVETSLVVSSRNSKRDDRVCSDVTTKGTQGIESLNGGDYSLGIFQSIGFKEFHEYLLLPEQLKHTKEGQKLYKKGVDALKIATRRYARRQIKWIRNRLGKDLQRQVPPLYSLDATEPSHWKERVNAPAMAVVEALLANTSVPSHIPAVELLPADPVYIEGRFERNYCEVCERVFIGRYQWNVHIASRNHKRVKHKKATELMGHNQDELKQDQDTGTRDQQTLKQDQDAGTQDQQAFNQDQDAGTHDHHQQMLGQDKDRVTLDEKIKGVSN